MTSITRPGGRSDQAPQTIGPVRALFLVYLTTLADPGDPARSGGWIELRRLLEANDVNELRDRLLNGMDSARHALASWATRPEDALVLLNEITENLAGGPAMSHWRHRETVLAAVRALGDLDALVRGSEACAWWWQDAPAEQVLTEGRGGRRPPIPLGPEGERWGWWLTPEGPGVAVSTRGPVGSAKSVSQVCRDGHFVSPDCPRVVPYAPPAGPVLEVRSASDWANLVGAYPLEVNAAGDRARDWTELTSARGPWLEPDFAAAKREWAGIHVSIGAFVDAAYCPIPVGDNFSVLVGWDPDATVWLSDNRALMLR